jgi:hypothetical protein
MILAARARTSQGSGTFKWFFFEISGFRGFLIFVH